MNVCNKNFRKAFWGHVRDLIIVVIIGDGITFLFNPNLESFLRYFWSNTLYSLIIGTFLWKGNQFVGYFLSKKLNVIKSPAKSLLWNLSTIFLYSTLAIIFVNYMWFIVIHGKPSDFLFKGGYLIMIIEMVVTIIIASILYSQSFFLAWRESAVNEERLKKESIKLQYNALKNQVNPHFLFNSLNSLTSLVYSDADQAVKFIKQLSEIYRYVLEHKDNELVLLEEEIQFCKRYIFLQQIRHGDNLKVNFKIEKNSGVRLVPVSLQILLENAIKHNEVSMDHPLTIDIFTSGDFIVVKNKKQSRSTIIESGGTGLNTLENRYAFLTDQKLIIEDKGMDFIVKVPFIKMEKA